VKRHLDIYDLESALNEVSRNQNHPRFFTNVHRLPKQAVLCKTSLGAMATECIKTRDLDHQYPLSQAWLKWKT
jgi:hypothetical protein